MWSSDHFRLLAYKFLLCSYFKKCSSDHITCNVFFSAPPPRDVSLGLEQKFVVMLPSFGEDFHCRLLPLAERLATSHNVAVILVENPTRGLRGPPVTLRARKDAVQRSVTAMLAMGVGGVEDARDNCMNIYIYMRVSCEKCTKITL